ncbi:hypothetical protein PATSB16_07050 [Pandoraea thiooxydans]|uniref:Enoyl reductase (ER) domain-containing protein n=1 Tax=Pandoraea thiooxydans TaxID=445709 RepID=A0A0U4EZJ1_9BURK|nr:alcohol dehydrogenase catalytic domain-containing protein [Pandoraea thiooxydans]ALX34851.1 hypothetical protein ABW99_20835 [Pandoraea thiooxydans]APR94047.1 hypothetical protein PATSB16_07050 [Pandoraea thiooxydans]
MQALIFEQTGEPLEVLALADVPVPQAGPGEVLIQVTARSIQPADSLFIGGRYRVKPVFPQIAGFDGAGVVSAVGAGVSGLAAGQRVAFRHPGAWAEFAVVPAARVYPVPDDLASRLDDTMVSQFALNPLTAWGLLQMVDLPRGSRLLATAGRSAIAGLLGYLGDARGIEVERLVRDNGAYRLLDASGQRTLALGDDPSQTLAGAAPYQAVLDAVGGPGTVALIDAMAPGGKLVSYGVLDDRPFEIRAATVLYRNLTWQGFGIAGWLDQTDAAALAQARRDCWEMLARRPDLLPVTGQYPLAEYKAALRQARASQGEGKVLLV